MEIVEKIKSGDIRAVSKVIRNIEDQNPKVREVIKNLYPYTGNARIVGLTGAPGAGKSTFTDSLIRYYRDQGLQVGVLAVDPTSPFTGGAILGDRIRMQNHAQDPGVFIRSLASRGAVGGLSESVDDAIYTLDAMGKDVILVETVGTGQSEVDIMNNSHTVLLLLTPGLGDEVQTIKAGIMEIADLFVINKADQQGSAKLYQELQKLLEMSDFSSIGWKPPVLKLESNQYSDKFFSEVEEVKEKIDEHYQVLIEKGLLETRERRKAMVKLKTCLQKVVLTPMVQDLQNSGRIDSLLEQLVSKQLDPYTLAEDLYQEHQSR